MGFLTLQSNRERLRAWGWGAALLVCFSVAQWVNGDLLDVVRARVEDSATVKEKTGDAIRWNPVVLRALSFGHPTLAADLLLIRFVAYENQAKREHAGGRSAGFYELDAASELDPGYLEIYSQGANYLAVARNDALGAREILERGMDWQNRVRPTLPRESAELQWPYLWHVPVVLAYVELFELQNPIAAAAAFRAAAATGQGPEYLKALAARVATPSGAAELGLRLVELEINRNREGDARREELLVRRRWVERLALRLLVEERYLAWKKNRQKADYATFLAAVDGGRDLRPESREFLEGADARLRDPAAEKVVDPWYVKYEAAVLSSVASERKGEP